MFSKFIVSIYRPQNMTSILLEAKITEIFFIIDEFSPKNDIIIEEK